MLWFPHVTLLVMSLSLAGATGDAWHAGTVASWPTLSALGVCRSTHRLSACPRAAHPQCHPAGPGPPSRPATQAQMSEPVSPLHIVTAAQAESCRGQRSWQEGGVDVEDSLQVPSESRPQN